MAIDINDPRLAGYVSIEDIRRLDSDHSSRIIRDIYDTVGVEDICDDHSIPRVQLRVTDTDIEYKYSDESPAKWTKLISLARLTGPKGADGKQIELDLQEGMIVYRYSGDTIWIPLFAPPKGDKGDRGDQGLDNYQLAIQNGFQGTLAQWLVSIRGANGTNGTNGVNGAPGLPGEKGEQGEPGTPGRNGLDAANVTTLDLNFSWCGSSVAGFVAIAGGAPRRRFLLPPGETNVRGSHNGGTQQDSVTLIVNGTSVVSLPFTTDGSFFGEYIRYVPDDWVCPPDPLVHLRNGTQYNSTWNELFLTMTFPLAD